jgi:hypothetical protein
MTLRAFLEQPADLFKTLKVQPPALQSIPRAAAAINDRGGVLRDGTSIPRLQDAILSAFAEGALDHLRPRDLRQAPRCFFEGPHPLGSDVGPREAILALIAKRQQKSAVLSAIFQYLEAFDTTDPSVARLGDWLAEVVASWDWPWRDRAKDYELFKVAAAPARLARAVLASRAPADRILNDIGLPEAAATGALGEAAFSAGCGLVSRAQQPAVIPLQQRIMSWARRGDRFSYPAAFAAYVAALLDPWANAEPPDTHRRVILGELEAFAGDPRIRPGRWNIVKDREPAAYATLLRWLTKASVYQFFDIVDRVADRQMWRYRRAFWTAFLEAGHIEQAWVVFGANGERFARQAARESGDKSLTVFGRLLSGRGRSPDHAALVMKIGDLTIAEWSHNGKYNIWPRGSTNAPKLFEELYHPDELRLAPIDGSHTSNESYGWQRTVAGIIRSHTGRTTLMSAWQPGRRTA